MADAKVSTLASHGTPVGADYVYSVLASGPTSKKLLLSDLKKYELAALGASGETAVTTGATATVNTAHKCSGTSADYDLTMPTGASGDLIGVRMEPELTKLVTLAAGITEAGDAGNRMSGWWFTGLTTANTNSWVLYWGIVGTTVTIYEDSACTQSVASGTVASGVANLTPTNSSGIYGKVSVTGSGDDAASSANTLTFTNLIDGCTGRVMWAGENALLRSDGTHWYKVAGKSIPLTAKLTRSTDLTGINASTWFQVALTTQSLGNATMFDAGNSRAKIIRTGNYICSSYCYVNRLTGTMTYAYVGTATNTGTPGTFTQAGAISNYAAVGMSVDEFVLFVDDYVKPAVYTDATTAQILGAGGASMTVVEVPQW